MRVEHMAIAVDDMDAALAFWERALGLEVQRIEQVEQEAVEVAFLAAENAQLELVHPLDGASGIARWLAARGPGMHHLCLEVADLEEAMRRLVAGGAELINDTPRVNSHARRYVFVHPRSTGGVLLELYEELCQTGGSEGADAT